MNQPAASTVFHRALRLLVIVFTLAGFAAAWAAPVKFNIPAQPAAEALVAFSKQSGIDVLFAAQDLKKLTAKAVIGEFEPADAIKQLLAGSGFQAVSASGKFLVERAKPLAGAIEGTLVAPAGLAIEGVRVLVAETGATAKVDRSGVFRLPAVEPGTYTLVASGEGLFRLKITDVVVRPGENTLLGAQQMPAALKDGDIQKMSELVVSASKDVQTLQAVEVSGDRVKPFTTANMDLPRTIDDVQPYVIFDAKTIDQSGAANVEDFLKTRLTMNAAALSNGQQVQTTGNTSTINLRGLGSDKTLILVNGRRLAAVTKQAFESQPDLNGIPLNAIDRIEVLPSSASGIYGGSALGGVVNVVLKKNYAGGEIRTSYDNTWDTDSASRSVALSYGMAFNGGKTNVMFNASWSDGKTLLLQDRREIFEKNLATALRNSPTFIFASTSAILGAQPNIVPSSSAQTTLTLKNGTVINARPTHISAGTAPTVPAAELYASLAANGGTFSTELPRSTQAPSGLARPFGATPTNRAVMASVRHQVLPWLEAFADFSYAENRSRSVFSPFSVAFTVPIAAPTNPFTTAVSVRIPDAAVFPLKTESTNRSMTVGAIAKLPREWTGVVDFTWSENRLDYSIYNNSVAFNGITPAYDTTAVSADLLSGALNPFVDTLRYPLNLAKYAVRSTYAGRSELQDLNLRASGPLPALPWGRPTLTLGLEHRLSHVPKSTLEGVFPITTANSYRMTYYARDAETDSGYAETSVPLIKSDWLPGVHALEFQASGRNERYKVDTGTTDVMVFYNRSPQAISYDGFTLNGQPYFSATSYSANSYTAGFKYQPVPSITLRASRATAFIPPAPGQLYKNPTPFSGLTVNDPVTGQTGVAVIGLSGGNPDLTPQHSKSANAGLVWEPRWKSIKGLRLDAEYYKIEQADAIDTLSAQQIVNQEKTFPGRVTRSSTGTITQVDISAMNLYRRVTEGWDLSADYAFPTSLGRFNLHAVESIIRHLRNQVSQTLPETEAAGYAPAESGAPKYKSAITLTWQQQNWTAGWTTRYQSSYKVFGAAGGPYSITNLNGAASPTYILAQGSDTVASQIYHDLFVGYTFGKMRGGESKLKAIGTKALDNLTVQLGVRNVFDRVPPFDVYNVAYYYISPYGDMRLRTYSLSLRKEF